MKSVVCKILVGVFVGLLLGYTFIFLEDYFYPKYTPISTAAECLVDNLNKEEGWTLSKDNNAIQNDQLDIEINTESGKIYRCSIRPVYSDRKDVGWFNKNESLVIARVAHRLKERLLIKEFTNVKAK